MSVVARLGLVLTCEHASACIPRALGDLGLPAAVRRSHRAFDVGALPIARALARRFRATLFAGRWSRLVADLNRSDWHARVVPRRLDGSTVPGNQLSRAQHELRLRRYWRPWRAAAEQHMVALARRVPVLHLSVHSFVERLDGAERQNDVGLLHDPERPGEAALCRALKTPLVAAGLRVRRNFPYFGNTDGFTSHLRRMLPADRYRGIELECNQRLARTGPGQRRLAAALGEALAAALR